MTLGQPLWLALLPVLATFVLALHAQRRRDLPIASLVVWRRVPATTAAAPQRRRIPWRDPRMWLQLLAVIVATLALARPVLGAAGADAHWIVVIDTSTSMNAVDVAPSRFGAAVAEARERWATRPGLGHVSIVQTGATTRVVAARWPVGPGLVAAFDTLSAAQAPADWNSVAQRVRLLAAHDATAQVVVFTDAYGAGPARDALAGAGIAGDRTDVVVLGDALVNVGVGDVTATLRGDRADQWAVRGRVSTVGLAASDTVRVVASYRPFGGETFLPWGGVDVTLGRDGSAEFEMPLDLPGPGELELRGPAGDRLDVDDRVIVPLRAEPVRVVVLGTPEPALLRALGAIGGLEVFLAESLPDPSAAAAFDLAVVTSDVGAIPATSTVWLGVVPTDVAAGEPLLGPLPPLTAGSHRLAQDLDPDALELARAVPLRLLAGAAPLLRAGDATLAWARTTSVGRQVVLGFGPGDGDWSAQLSFPAFLAAAVDWAAPRTWSDVPGGCQAGRACPWPRDAFRGTWVLHDPDGAEVARPTSLRPVVDDPLADAVWDEAWFDAGFVPQRAGDYALVFDDGSIGLPVVTRPIGGNLQEPSDAVSDVMERPTRDLGVWLALLGLALVLADGIAVVTRRAIGPRRRPWRTVAIAGVTVLAWSLAALDVPLLVPREGGQAVWVGPTEAAGDVLDAERAAPGWSWSWVGLEAVGAAGADPEDGGEGDRIAAAALAAPDLATALELALAYPATAPTRHVVIAADTARTIPASEAAVLAQRAVQEGVVFDVAAARADGASASSASTVAGTSTADGSVTRLPAIEPDALAVRLDRVSVPDDVRAGARFSLRAAVQAPDDVAWSWRAERIEMSPGLTEAAADGAGQPGSAAADGGAASGPEATAVAAVRGTGSGVAELELQAGDPGELHYRLTLQRDGDPGPGAETAVTVAVGPRLRVLMVATDEDQGARLAEGLAAQAIDVDRVIPFRMPSSLERLAAYDAVALVNVPAQEMFTAYQEMLLAYVRDEGGGLVIFGGPSSYGPGGYFRTPLEDLSPLSAQITDDAPEVAMAFVLDRSGSMNGAVGTSTRMDVAKVATLEALGLLGANSLAAIIVFDTEAQVLLPLRSVRERAAFEEALTSVNAAGGTAIYPGLVAAYEMMRDSDSATRHVVVMTDGLSQEADFATVLGALGEIGVSTSFVGVGDAADRRQLTTLANLSGGALHMALDFGALPGILAQEAMMLSAQPIVERPAEADWVAGSAPTFLKGVVAGSPPSLAGYVRTTAKDEAAVHLVERSDDDPLLASWRYGLGRVVAFASEADGPWASTWTAAPEFARLWSQTIRWTADRPVREPGSLQIAGTDGVVDVVVSVPVEAGADAVGGLEVELVAEGGGGPVRTPLRLVSPGRAAARFEVAAGWAGTVTVRVPSSRDVGVEAQERSFAWPLPPTQALRSDGVALDRLAASTGGSVLELGEVRLGNVAPRWTWGRVPEFWWLLGLAAFLVALAVRYGAVSAWSARLRERSATRTRTASPAP